MNLSLQRLTVSVGDPIDFSKILETHREQKSNAVSHITTLNTLYIGIIVHSQIVMRKHITDIIQEQFAELKNSTEELHAKWTKKT